MQHWKENHPRDLDAHILGRRRKQMFSLLLFFVVLQFRVGIHI